MGKIRVMHYLNQFFAGIGGEEMADVPIDSRQGPVGPGKRLQALFKDSAEIVVTAYCGDNYFTEHTDEVSAKILQIAREHDIKMLIAGPAFASGRYGFACVEVCHSLSTVLSLDCVTGMHIENAGVGIYRQYKDRQVWLFPTSEAVTGMQDALSKMAQCARKLATGSAMGSASEEGYLSLGLRSSEFVSRCGAERAVDMLLDKLAGRSFATEIPIENSEEIPIASPITDLKNSCIALATSSGVVPQGNPDGFKAYKNTQWRKYLISELESMKDTNWEVMHGGYNTAFMQKDPNYGVPLDVFREMEREGAFARLYPYFYMTTGARGAISDMEAIGGKMALDMKAEGIDAVLLVSTWGSGTRSGATIAREIEKQGIPVAFITAMTMVGKNTGAIRIIRGIRIPHPCGDPNLPAEADRALRREIVERALGALQTNVSQPTVFEPGVRPVSG